MNFVPNGSKENNTSFVEVIEVCSLKINALCKFETLETYYSVTRGHASEQRSPLPYLCEDAKTLAVPFR
jgi:hypothetical protein